MISRSRRLPHRHRQDALRQASTQRSGPESGRKPSARRRAHALRRPRRAPPVHFRQRQFRRHRRQPRRGQGTYTLAGTVRVPIWLGGQNRSGHLRSRCRAGPAPSRTRRPEELNRGRSPQRLSRFASRDQPGGRRQDKSLREPGNPHLTRQRFDAGVTDTVEVVQTEETVASAQLDYINSVFAHNVAKLSLARAIGATSGDLSQFLKLP